MRKNGRLYTVNKWNKRGIASSHGNLFPYGDLMDNGTYSYGGLNYISPQSNLVESHSGPSWEEISTQINGRTVDTSSAKTAGGTAGTSGSAGTAGDAKKQNVGFDILKGLTTAASPALTGLISNGYSTGGIGEGISTVSNAIGSAVGAIPVVGRIAGPAVKLLGAISGGLYNRFKGVKENKENIAALDANTAAARSAGKALASSTSTDEYIKNSGNMVNSLGFNWRDLYENGWATDAGTRKGNAKLDINKSALAYQTHAGATGADNVDYYNDANTLSSFKFAEGGFLPMVNTDNMGAIEYGFINDWLTNKKRQTESKGVLGGNGTLFADGGDEDKKIPAFLRYASLVTPSQLGLLPSQRTFNNVAVERADTTQQERDIDSLKTTITSNGYNKLKPLGDYMEKAILENERSRQQISDFNREVNQKNREKLFAEGGDTDPWADIPNKDLPPSVLLRRLEAKKKAAQAPKPVPGVFGGGEFGGGNTSGTFEVGENTFPQARDFNEAYDMAVANRLSTFTFNNKRYNTKKENNPVRELNNRLAGQLRVRDEKADTVYDRKPYMIGTAEENIPLITDRNFRGLGGTLFAIGGDLQTNGADWSTGLTHINAGQSHELNPNEGVQVGVDSEGTPNLVEEGETIFNDYVYSNRIGLDEEAKKAFHVGKKRHITYAEMSKKLEKEAAERPNDPISKAALQKQMEELANHQERQKQEMEAERAEEYFNSLSDEEKVALMQQVAGQQAQEEAAMQEAAAQQQPTQEEMMAAQQQVSPEEAAMIQQQQMQGQPTMGQPEVVGGQPMMAEGGKINKFAPGGKKNAGTFKTGTIAENWSSYTKGGLRDYLNNIIARINAAPNEDAKNEIRQEAINTVQNIQQAYAKAYQGQLTPSEENQLVRNLQQVFQEAGGNKYFGNISENINLPAGHNTTDTEKGGYVDGYWGPRTSIRNWGSTEYGDANYYKDIADLAQQAGLTYAPETNWTYGGGENPYQLYGLSMAVGPNGYRLNSPVDYNLPEVSTTAPETVRPLEQIAKDKSTPERTVTAVDNNTNLKVTNNGSSPQVVGGTSESSVGNASNDNSGGYDVIPVHRKEWPRYAGLFGPITGLGLMAAGIGKPDYSILNGVLDKFEESGTRLADYQRIGNYLVYRPMDIWAEQNRMDANSRATDRTIMNNAAPIGTQMAGALANAYTSQLGSGQLYRNALEYNDNLRKQVADFNRATDMFNATAYNQASLQNAQIQNHDRALRAQLAMDAARQKMSADADWYKGIYGNVGGIFQGLSELGKENAQHNMIADMAATGIFGTIKNQPIANGYVKVVPRTNTGKYGGKMKKKKRGLTC